LLDIRAALISNSRGFVRPATVLAAILASTLLLSPAIAVAQSSPVGSGKSVTDQLDELRRRLAETDRNTQDLLVLIQESDRRLQELNSILANLEPRVAEATARLGQAQADLDNATSLYLMKVAEVDELDQRYAALRQRVAFRLARAYKDSSFIEVKLVLEAKSLSELGRSRSYLNAVVAKDRRDQDELIYVRDRLDSERALLEETKDELLSRRNAVEVQTDELVGLYRSNVAARDLVQKELQNHRELLSIVLADRAQALRMLDELDGVSDEAKRDLLAGASRGNPPILPGYFIWPADGPITSYFGPRKHPVAGVVRQHNGIDIGAAYGAPIWAAAAGKVLKAGSMGGYGLVVILDHGDGLSTLYAHQSRVSVSVGDFVPQGAVIGEVGSTGYSTGPHLHFEVRINGEPVDPLQWFPGRR
jgi:murein DD-endopeptidase MepM/ murein hydrolase activator NlpD